LINSLSSSFLVKLLGSWYTYACYCGITGAVTWKVGACWTYCCGIW